MKHWKAALIIALVVGAGVFEMARASTGALAGWSGGANRALAKVYGSPGDSLKMALSGTDATLTVNCGVMYRIYCVNDCWWRLGTAAAANTALSTPMKAQTPEAYMFCTSSGATTTAVLHGIVASVGTNDALYATPITEPSDL